MRLMRALDRELRKIWAVQLAYNVQFGSSLRDDLIQLRGDQYELIGDVLGDVDSQPASTEQIFEWYRKLKDTTFENYSLGRTPVRHDHPENGCWLRAHAWAMDLRRMGADAMKIFVIRDRPRLSIYSPYLEGALPGIPGKIEPQYHVAPMVQGHTDSGPRLWVLDRAVSANSDDHDGRPLTMEEWLGQLGVDAYDRESVTYLGGPAEQVQQWFTEYCSTMPTTTYSNGQVYPDGRAVVLVVPAHFYWPPVPGVPEQIPGSLLGADLAFRDEESKLIEMNRTAERRARQRLEEAPGVFAADGSRPRPVGEPGAPVPGETRGVGWSGGLLGCCCGLRSAGGGPGDIAAGGLGGRGPAVCGHHTRWRGGHAGYRWAVERIEYPGRGGCGASDPSTSDPDSARAPGQRRRRVRCLVMVGFQAWIRLRCRWTMSTSVRGAGDGSGRALVASCYCGAGTASVERSGLFGVGGFV
ncbi:protein-glutamine glutaminase family protein [Saccharopolyspora spinosa]|uniref:protein-glutamine glutaminase family protein n=1 Tax=Saccharopolyspora spinosa TaxID=60894 RepID=UPI00376F018C